MKYGSKMIAEKLLPYMRKKMKVLMVFAHPDDEIIFGWPIFQDPTIEKELVMVTSDFNNPGQTTIRT